jgi:hypothetical protein
LFDREGGQSPSPAFGEPVQHVPTEISKLYDEARNCMKVAAYSCAVLGLRTLLAHIAVERGAPSGKPFAAYVKFLTEKGFAPAGSEA